jgi:sugar phosphate isomerase/epimerase
MFEPEFLAAYWTLAGNVVPLEENELSPFSFQDRVKAAADAGYSGLGLIHADLVHQGKLLGYSTMKAILQDHGLKHLELEFLTDWFADGERKRQSDALKRDLFEAAAALGARHIKLGGDFWGNPWPTSHLAETFRQTCDQAKDYGVMLVLEPQPWTNVRTIDLGLEIVSQAAATNGGLLLDIWHIARGGNAYTDILKIPPHFIQAVELDDAMKNPVGTLWDDTIHHRELCGEGELNPPAFLKCLEEIGYQGPYGIEIISKTHRTRPLAEAAERSIESALRQFPQVTRSSN